MKISVLHNADEAYLVKCCQGNDPAAQKVLYGKYAEDMMLLCLRYITNAEDAREVLMDGFYSFFKNISSFTYRGDGSTKAWLKKIMVNQCLMRLRKPTPPTDVADLAALEDAAADDDILAALSAKELLQMIHSLPEGYRAVFNLYVFEEMAHNEIGELLGISESTSKSQLHRAKTLLKKKILQASS